MALCPACHRQLRPGAGTCGYCGRPVSGAAVAFELVLPDGARVDLAGGATLGREEGNEVRIDHPTVSRRHARISASSAGPVIEDAGSSYGTLVDGSRVTGPVTLADGSAIRVGDVELRVERRRGQAEAGGTVVVAAHVEGPAAGAPPSSTLELAAVGYRPRLRAAVVVKRLDASEGDDRFVLRSPDGSFVRMNAADAGLVELLGEGRPLPELLTDAERALGPAGPGRLALVLADLGERGMLDGVEGAVAAPPPRSRVARALAPRDVYVVDPARALDRIYRAGGWLLFTTAGLAALTLVAVAGVVAFAYLIVNQFGTPFVVASKVGLGGLVFIAGRFAIVALHETAHGLTVTSFGRQVHRSGLRLILCFPYAFADTSESWFESRRARIAISAAGPFSDLVAAGMAAIAAALVSPGNLRDILYQVAFAGYIGAMFNLNPLIERDGYQILVDLLREPGLRRRSRRWFSAVLAGRRASEPPAGRGLRVYSVAAVLWTVGTIAFVILLTIRYHAVIASALRRPGLTWAILGGLWIVMLLPLVAMFVPPLAERLRGERP